MPEGRQPHAKTRRDMSARKRVFLSALYLAVKERLRPYYLRWVYFRCFKKRRPEYFVTCWQGPFRRIGKEALFPVPQSGLPDLFFYPMVDWHTRIQRSQHLVRAFANLGYRCIYLNPHLGRQFDTVPPADKAHRLSLLAPNIYELHVRLPREPVFHHRLLQAEEERVVAEAVETVADAFGTRNAVQIVSFPVWCGAVSRLRGARGFPVVYDCHDFLAGFANVCPDIVAEETALLASAELVLFSSERLRDRHGTSRSQSLLCRNAAEAEQFWGGADAGRTDRPVAGYVGALDWWFDVQSVAEAARANPKCRFILAGRIEHPPIRSLVSIPNVELIGEVPYERLPQLLREFSVGLIPFLMNELTVAVDPIKLYEYFSLGLPVVSAPLPEVLRAGALVRVAGSPAEFAAQVCAALGEDDVARRQSRRDFARRESWAARAQEIAGAIGRILEKAPRRAE